MELMVPIQTQSGVPLYEQIYEYIKSEIRKGNLRPMSKLPSTRVLADYLKVSRSTTQMAYEQLVSEGYIETIPCKGYFVANIEELMEVRQEISGNALPNPKPEGTPYEIDFSPRGIDLNHFPYHVWKRMTRNTLVDDKKEMFLNGNPQGELPLREAIRSYLHSARGVNCQNEQIIVGAGNEYLLMLLYQILGSGRRIAMENPTYKQAYRVFDSLGYRVISVDMDRYGLNTELLEVEQADIAYVMPSHQYPMGIVMPIKRRQELLSWANQKDGRFLIEDDYDSEFRYKGKPIPALQGMDTFGRVIYIGTFSRSIAPAIRVSYMVLPNPLLEIYQKKVGFYASTVSRIDQNILYQFLSEGHYERHLNRMRAIYKAKHDVLMTELKQLEPYFQIKGEYAGVHILLTHKGGKQEEWLVGRAKAAGMRVYGLSAYFISPQHNTYPSTIILGYANLSEAQIVRGVALLKDAWSS